MYVEMHRDSATALDPTKSDSFWMVQTAKTVKRDLGYPCLNVILVTMKVGNQD